MLGFFGEEVPEVPEEDADNTGEGDTEDGTMAPPPYPPQKYDDGCTTLVEDYKLQNAGDYMRLVSSGMAKGYKSEGHPGAAEEIGGFEIFYGVQSDPAYIAMKKKSKKKAKEKELSGFGNIGFGFGELGCGGDCACKSCSGNSMSGLGCDGDTACAKCSEKSMSGFGALPPGDLGPNYGVWPPGPKPEPYKWTSNDGTTYTLVQVDGKWMYQSSKNPRLFISTSNLYELMGVKTNPVTLVAVSDIPGEPHPEHGKIHAEWSQWQIAGIGAGWVILGGIGAYLAVRAYKKRGR